MKLRAHYFTGNWDGYEEDLAVSSWEPDAKDPSIVVASATITHYHGEQFNGETIKATERYDLECGSIPVRLQAGEGYDSAIEYTAAAPNERAMLGLLDVLSEYRRGCSRWEWCGVAWLAHTLVQSAFDGRTGASDHPAVAIMAGASEAYMRACMGVMA